MPLIHFAFGGHFRDGNTDLQTEEFLEKILSPKTLRSFVCPEFLPRLSVKGGKTAVPASAVETGDGGVTFTEYVQSPPVFLLPCDVPMVSFVDISFKKLKAWEPSNHYGQLGIAFTNEFKRRHSAKHVGYYQQANLARDPKVLALDEAYRSDNVKLQKVLVEEILNLRKPARLWEEFITLFTPLKLTKEECGVTIDRITYSRYEVGYDFTTEHEVRIVTEQEGNLVEFEEKEVLALIAPNEKVRSELIAFTDANWSSKINVMVYPQ
jgi:hypothetical protein